LRGNRSRLRREMQAFVKKYTEDPQFG